MNKLEIKRTNIKEKKEFTISNGERLLRQYGYNENEGTWLYEKFLRFEGEWSLIGYELVKPPKVKNPDGSVVHRYPSSEEWGRYGWDLPKCKTEEEKANLLSQFKRVN